MKIAIPLVDGKLSAHFGHCQNFGLFDVDEEKKEIKGKEILPSPPHEPGALPRWLHEKGANMIIAGGMGMRAQQLFDQNGIRVLVGAPAVTGEDIVQAFLAGTLTTGDNLCDH